MLRLGSQIGPETVPPPAWITVAMIAFYNAVAFLIVGNFGIRRRKGTQLAIDTFGCIPLDHAGIFIFGQCAGRAVLNTSRFTALPALSDAV